MSYLNHHADVLVALLSGLVVGWVVGYTGRRKR
jgi:hypothetical protein